MARTPYTPPAFNAVDFGDRGAYTAPSYDQVNFGVELEIYDAGQTLEWSLSTFQLAGQNLEYRLDIPQLYLGGQNLEWSLETPVFTESGQNLQYRLGVDRNAGQNLEYSQAVDLSAGQNLQYILGLYEAGQNLEWALQPPQFAGQSLEWRLDAEQLAGQNLEWSLSAASVAAAQNLQWSLTVEALAGQNLEWDLPQYITLPSVADLRFYLSGGDGNIDPELALGGIRATAAAAELSGQDVTIDEPFAGIRIVYAANNALGEGTLTWDGPSQSVTWAGPGQSAGEGVTLGVAGEISVDDTVGYLVLEVDPLSLSTESEQVTIGIRQPKRTLLPDITPAMAKTGRVDYRCIYVINQNLDFDLLDLQVYMTRSSVYPDIIGIGLDPAGIGDGVSTGVATTIVSGQTPPVGVTFSQPTEGAPLAIGDLAVGETFALWIGRTLAAGNTVYYPRADFQLHWIMDF